MNRESPRDEPRFGAPILFDLTAFEHDKANDAEASNEPIYYMVAEPVRVQARSVWWGTAAGISAVLVGGLTLGLVLAQILL